MLADAAASSANATWALVVLGAGGSLVGAITWLIHRGKRDQKIDELLAEVKPNGGNTQSLGDIAKRTEQKVDHLRDDFQKHVGHSDAVEIEVFRRLRDLEGGSGGARRPPSNRRRG